MECSLEDAGKYLRYKLILDRKLFRYTRNAEELSKGIDEYQFADDAALLATRRLLGYMYRTFSPYCSQAAIIHLYKSQVIPIIEYGCVVWDTHLQKDQILLDNVQCFAVKVATKNLNNSSPSLPTNLHLPPLTNRRTYFKLVCTYKFLYGHLYCPLDFLNLHPNPNLRVNYSKQLVQPLAKTVSYYHSFL